MNLYDIMLGAQGGQAVNNLASQFGLSPQQTQAAIQAMIPAFSQGLQQTVQNPSGLGGVLGQMMNTAHAAGYSDPSQLGQAGQLGGNVLGQIFGSPQVAQQIGQQASQMSGVNPQIIMQMMPIVASILMGGLAQGMASQGLGGLLGQLASAFGTPAAANAAPAGAGGPLAGWMNMIGGLLGMGSAGSPAGAAGAATPQSAALQAGLSTLTAMLEAGVQVSQAHQQGLSNILNSISAASRPNQG